VISGFWHGVNKFSALAECYPTLIGS